MFYLCEGEKCCSTLSYCLTFVCFFTLKSIKTAERTLKQPKKQCLKSADWGGHHCSSCLRKADDDDAGGPASLCRISTSMFRSTFIQMTSHPSAAVTPVSAWWQAAPPVEAPIVTSVGQQVFFFFLCCSQLFSSSTLLLVEMHETILSIKLVDKGLPSAGPQPPLSSHLPLPPQQWWWSHQGAIPMLIKLTSKLLPHQNHFCTDEIKQQ